MRILNVMVGIVLLTATLSGCDAISRWTASNEECSDTLDNQLSTIEYGFVTDSFLVVRDEFKRNQNLSSLLMQYQVPAVTIDKLAKASKEVFDVRKLAAGKPYTIFCSKDGKGVAQCLVYEVNHTDYVVFDMRDSMNIYMASKPVEMKLRHIKGEIHSSLYETLNELEADPEVAVALADIYAWTIDFYKIQKGDGFEVLYEEFIVEGRSVAIGRVLASSFLNNGKHIKAYRFDGEGEQGYFDGEGNSLKKAFLKAPVKFSRISSGYSTARLHPVLKTLRPHFGTDYAAPTGTPIMAVGDGVITEARYSGGNGNYVKMRHSKVYETQYLHMSKIANGIRPGRRVSQGDVIGYVGSTGLATGPHVCFRFWKNGKQVDHRKENLPIATSVSDRNLQQFKQRKLQLDSMLLANTLQQPLL
jgi:murein DD-endopeptidase MepM/ murein hydrolase activator NlpD